MGKNTIELLNRLSAELDEASDYAVANALDVTRATVSKWRNGKGGTSDETALKAAALLQDDPIVLLMMAAEDRAETKLIKGFYGKAAEIIKSSAAMVAPIATTVALLALTGLEKAEALVRNVCILCHVKQGLCAERRVTLYTATSMAY